MSEQKTLTKDEIDSFVSQHSDWAFESDRLVTNYSLKDFDEAIEVMNKVVEVARKIDHHPLMTNVYNRLSFSLCTHSVGDKVTELDVKLAKLLSEIITEIEK